MKQIFFILTTITLLLGLSFGANAVVHSDDFGGPELDESKWTWRSPDGNDEYEFKNGWFHVIIQAGQDLYIQGTDLAPMLLTDPPEDDENFSIETCVNVTVDVAQQPPACQAGPILFNESAWAYTLWGPYNNQDIRVEDCIGGSYRWRDQAQIGIDERGDEASYLKIVKTGEKLEFFYKNEEGDDWESGGVDADHIGPQLQKGKYQIGLYVKNWGGSVPTEIAFDYFDCPELGWAVKPADKLSTTWARIKGD